MATSNKTGLIERIWLGAPRWLRRFINSRVFGNSKRVKFYTKLSDYTKYGAKVEDSLSSIITSAANNKMSHLFILKMVKKRVVGGKTLSESLEPFVPFSDCTVLKTSDNTGEISSILKVLAESLEKIGKIKFLAKATSILTIALLAVTFGLTVFISTNISLAVKGIMAFAPNAYFPDSVLYFVAFGDFIIKYLYWIIFGFILLVTFIFVRLPKGKGPIREFIQKYFIPWTVYRKFISANFFLSLSTLLKSGVIIERALNTINSNVVPYYAYYLNQMEEKYRKTSNAQIAFHSKMFDPETNDDLAHYMKSTDLSVAIDQMAVTQLDRASVSIKTASAVAVVLVGLVMAVVAFWALGSLNAVVDVLKQSASY